MTLDASSPAADSRPTLFRWYFVAVATLMSTLMYLDRYAITFAASLIQEDLGLTDTQASWILSAFFWSYALAQIPSGWLSDKWGGRAMLTAYIMSWSLFTLLLGWSTSLWFLLAMQLGVGLGQAGAYPTSAGLLSQWMPLNSRGIASSIVAFGGRLGALIQPILTAALIVLFVPVTASSLIGPRQLFTQHLGSAGQVLLASQQTAPEGTTDYQQPLKLKIWNALSPDSQAVLQSAAAAEDARTKTTQPLKLSLSPDQQERLLADLNGLLRRPRLADPTTVQGLKLAQQGLNLLKRETAGTELTSQETERLNRLVLEALFPKLIGKVFVRGWRPVFTIYGLVGVIVALTFWLTVRNSPRQHPGCNLAEIQLIEAGRQMTSLAQAAGTPPPPLRWGQIFRSTSLWLSSMSQVGTNIGWLFVAAKLPEYLEKVHHVEIVQRGVMTSIPMAGGIAGMLLGGRLTDWLRLKLGVRWGRAIPMGVTRFGAAAAYIGCIFATDPWVATFLCLVVAFFTDLGVAASWAFVQDAGGRYVGVVLGFGNMWGNIGAAIAPQCYVYALKWTDGNWNACFALCAATLIASGVAALLIDASKPIVEET